MKAGRLIALMLAAALLALPLAACGKRNGPVPPPDQPKASPGLYPSD